MATNLTASLTAAIQSTLNDNAAPGAPAGATGMESNPADSYSDQEQSQFQFGTGANLANSHFHGQWTCAAGGQVVFDVAGALNDAFGDGITAAEIKGIMIRNLEDTPGEVLHVFGDNAAGAAVSNIMTPGGTDAVVIGPNGFIMVSNPIDGWAVVGGASDEIEVHNPGASDIDFEIFILIEE